MDNNYIDPYRYKDALYDKLNNDSGSNSELAVSSPYKMLFESINESMFGLDTVIKSNLALTNPILASTREELFAHLSDRDEQYLFSTPAKTTFTLRIPLKNVLDAGIYIPSRDVYTLTIPKNSYILVDNISFTLLYPITIEIANHDGFIPYVNYDITDDTIVYGEEGYGEASIVVDSSNEEWVVFNTQFAQLSVAQYLSNAIVGNPYDAEFNLHDTYFYSTMELKVNGLWTKIEKHYVDNLFELDKPSCLIKIGDDTVRYTIPQNFIDGGLNGSIRTTVYETVGKIRMSMRGYTPDDFKFFINSNAGTKYESASQGLTILVSNTSVIDGGTLPVSFRNLKARIINRATSRIDVPITIKHLNEVIRREGMVGELVEDSLYARLFLAKQETWDNKKDNAFPVAFMNTISMQLYHDPQSTIHISEDYLEFKPNTIFKQDGELVIPITKTDRDILFSLSRRDLIKEVNNTKYFTNIYTSIIRNSNDTTEAKIYEEHKPSFKKLRITNRNIFSPIKCGITTKEVKRVGDVLNIRFKLAGNIDFKEIKEQVIIQLTMRTLDGTINHTSAYFPDDDVGYYEINISIASYIKDEKLLVTNGLSSNIDRKIDLTNDFNIFIYTLNPNTFISSSIEARSYIDADDIKTTANTSNLLGLTKEHGVFEIVKELENVWRNASVNTLTTTYQKHTIDVPMRYETDIYEIDPRTGSTYFIYDTDNDGTCDTLKRNKLHNIGDIVLDEQGEIVYKYKIGDVKTDISGSPLKTNDVNYTVVTDSIMIDAKYTILSNILFETYLKEQKNLLDVIIEDKMRDINAKVLDNTRVLFKPKNSITKVLSTDELSYDSLVKPKIVIYYNKDIIYPEIDDDALNIMIGGVLRKYLSKRFFTLKEIEDEINSNMNDVVAIDIIDFTEDKRKAFNLTTKNSFYLDTVLLNSGKMLYDLSIISKYI